MTNSPAPQDWHTGQWRRECRLLAMEGAFYQTADGFHPAGAVTDENRGVQHIFVYCGKPDGPAGIFRITRALDTAALKRSLLCNDIQAALNTSLPFSIPFRNKFAGLSRRRPEDETNGGRN